MKRPFDCPDLIVISPRRFQDNRGWFSETWTQKQMHEAGITERMVQDNHSYSATAGTLRGLHYQRSPRAQHKLVRCSRGTILDVAVDARLGSATYGRSYALELSASNGKQLFIPKGFLHGFQTLEDDCEVQYKCSDYYAPDHEGIVRWDSIGFDWPLTTASIISDKDRDGADFALWVSPFNMGEPL